MRSPSICLALFVPGLIAFIGDPQAQAGGRRHFQNYQPAPVYYTTEPVLEATPVARKKWDYRLWVYHPKMTPKWTRLGPAHGKHSALHKKGKEELGRTHVHPRYWTETGKAREVFTRGDDVGPVAANDRTAATQPGMIFTITIDAVGVAPVDDPSEELPDFCLYYCEDGWSYKTTHPDYQTLYKKGLDAKLEFLECFETCERDREKVAYFTVCADGDYMYGGGLCCPRRAEERMYVPACPPACVPVCETAGRKHCRFGGLFRSRRGCAPGCMP